MSTSRRKAQKNNMSAAFSPTVDFEPFLERNNLLLPTEKLRPFRLSHRPTNRQTEKPTNKAVKFIFPFSFFPPPPWLPLLLDSLYEEVESGLANVIPFPSSVAATPAQEFRLTFWKVSFGFSCADVIEIHRQRWHSPVCFIRLVQIKWLWLLSAWCVPVSPRVIHFKVRFIIFVFVHQIWVEIIIDLILNFIAIQWNFNNKTSIL